MRAAVAVQSLLGTSADCDPLYTELHDHSVILNKQWTTTNLQGIAALAKTTANVFPQLNDKSKINLIYKPMQLDFITALGTHAELTEWLLDKQSSEDFNKLLQVCKQNSDEARVVSAIASLVSVRNSMLTSSTFYEVRYENLTQFVKHIGGLT